MQRSCRRFCRWGKQPYVHLSATAKEARQVASEPRPITDPAAESMENIRGANSNLDLATNNQSIKLRYTNATKGWQYVYNQTS